MKWRYTGSPARWNTPQPGGVTDRYANIDFFRTANIIDSGPSNEPGVMNQVAFATSQADVIFLLFSEENPFCPETWKLADHFHTNEYRNVVLVLTKFRGSSLEAGAILDKLRDISNQRWHYKVPAVAFITTSEQETQRSMESLMRTVASLGAVSPVRYKLLKQQLNTTSELIAEIKKVVSIQDAAMRLDGGFLQQLDKEIDNILYSELSKVMRRSEEMAQIATDCLPDAVNYAASRLGYVPNVFRIIFNFYKEQPERINKKFLKILEEALDNRMESYDRRFIDLCHAHWESIRPRSLAQLNFDIGDFPEKQLTVTLSQFRADTRQFIYKPLSELKFKAFLFTEYERRESWIKILLSICLGIFTMGCILGIIGFFMLMALATGTAVILWLLGIPALMISRKNIRENGELLQENFARIVQRNMKMPVEELTQLRVVEYRNTLKDIHTKISSTMDILSPIQAQAEHIYRNCYTLMNSFK